MPILVLKYPQLEYKFFKICFPNGSETVVELYNYGGVHVALMHFKIRKMEETEEQKRKMKYQTKCGIEMVK